MSLNRMIAAGAAVAVLASTMVFAGSHSTPESAAVKSRQAVMLLRGANAGVLFNMVKGSMDYDAVAAQAAADNLVSLATTMNQMAYWPPGSSSADMEGTTALPAIWEAGSDVGAKGKAMVDAAMAMQAAAGSLDGVKANIGAVGGACTACHKAYRQPES